MNFDIDIFNLAYYLLQPNCGQKTIKKIIKRGIKVKKCPDFFRESFQKENIHILPFWDERYPALLKQTSDFPVFLFAKGDVSLLQKQCVTVVGTRQITGYGFDVLEKLFQNKKHFPKNLCFVSGLANGVDSEVHRLCLKKNVPTIGVIAGGMDRNYYRGNSIMYKYLCKYRLVISEFPPGRTFFTGMFPLRNRILAGLSQKTFVVEAGEKSGALNTAGHANNYGRDIFVLPNDIFSEKSQGCLKLIQQGANVILNMEDFVRNVI